MLGYESLNSYSNISHFVTTRHGGCGEGTYDSFNCSPYCGDDQEVVRRNQQLLIGGLSHSLVELVIPHQTHGTSCVVIDDFYIIECEEEARRSLLESVDAVITNRPGYCLCISTADCVPVLLYDKEHQVVAAIHAGWRGTMNRIVQSTLERMKEVFGTEGDQVVACIGPSISLQSFEVGDEVYAAFKEAGFDMPSISMRKAETGKYHLDLWEANRMELLEFGMPASQIEVAGICTYTHHDEFFSARRLGIHSGRILSGIMLNGCTD